MLAAPVTQQFAVDVPSLAKNLFVEAGSHRHRRPTGTRENPYPTISAAMTAAVAGDVVAVLPGVYKEQVTMKQFVRLLSAAPSSTDSTVFTTSTGDALSTIIRAPFEVAAPAGTYATITAYGLESFSGLCDRDRRLHDRQPADRRPGQSESINPNAVGVLITNSNIVHRQGLRHRRRHRRSR